MREMKVLRCLLAALMVGVASPIIADAAPTSLEVLEKQLRELQTQIEQLKQDKQKQDRRMMEIEAAEKERAAKETEALRKQAKQGQEQERRTSILAEELEKLRGELVVPETAEYKSLYGLGASASRVYQVRRGLSLAGYGEAKVSFFMADNDDGPSKKRNTGDLERFIAYMGYKFSDRIIMNTEIEFEHGTTSSTKSSSGGSVSVEFSYLDFLLTEPANIRAGLLLMPMGFLNEIHEPSFFFGNLRPEVERRIIPTTWRELGLGLHGTLLPGLTYRTYVTNGLNAKGFTGDNIRGARQQGNRALFEDVAWTGRLDYSPIPGLQVGGSFFWGDTGQDQLFETSTDPTVSKKKKVNPNLTLFEGHAEYEYRGLRLRALYAQGNISDARTLSIDLKQPISSRIMGGYVEAGYDILPLIFPETEMSLAPFIRYERLDTQADVPSGFTADESKDNNVVNVGFSFKPIPNVVLKFDYRNISANKGKVADEINAGLGFNF